MEFSINRPMKQRGGVPRQTQREIENTPLYCLRQCYTFFYFGRNIKPTPVLLQPRVYDKKFTNVFTKSMSALLYFIVKRFTFSIEYDCRRRRRRRQREDRERRVARVIII